MDNKKFAKQLEERTLIFGVRIIQLSAKLPKTDEAKVIRTQLTKAGTSIGANYREANRSRSKANFKYFRHFKYLRHFNILKAL